MSYGVCQFELRVFRVRSVDNWVRRRDRNQLILVDDDWRLERALVAGLVLDLVVCVSIYMVDAVEDCFAALDATALFDEVSIVWVLLRQEFDDSLDEGG